MKKDVNMIEQIIKKTSIVGNLFGLNINSYKNIKKNISDLIILYENDNLVGSIEVEFKKNRDEIEKFRVLLYTSIGCLEGTFDLKDIESFAYNFIVNSTNAHQRVYRMVGIVTFIEDTNEDSYDIRAYLRFTADTVNEYEVSFNDCVNKGTLCIKKNYKEEEVKFNVTNQYDISHKIIKSDGEKISNEVSVTRENRHSPVLATYHFKNSSKFYEGVTLRNSCKNLDRFDTLVNLEKLNSRIKCYDSRIFDIIEEIRKLLSFENSSNVISLYDNLGQLCFLNSKNKIKDSLVKKSENFLEGEKGIVYQKKASN